MRDLSNEELGNVYGAGKTSGCSAGSKGHGSKGKGSKTHGSKGKSSKKHGSKGGGSRSYC